MNGGIRRGVWAASPNTWAAFRYAVCLGVGCLLLGSSGCQSERPEAPRLSDAPVYRSAREGFRFMVPEGWTQTASAVLPSGDLDGENFLVRYNVSSRQAGATLQVLCMQERGTVDLRAHHAGPSFGVRTWEPIGEAETVAWGGLTGERHRYRSGPMSKDVVCFRRRGRVYSFVGLYRSDDTIAEQQILRAVKSIVWEQ